MRHDATPDPNPNPNPRYMRHDAQLGDAARHLPVTCHVNYHPEKEARMRSISQFYLQGRREALDPWNGGEGQRPSRRGSCRGKVRARVRGGGRVALGEG